jgi:hypothetical protein
MHKDLEQIIEGKLIENILTELEEEDFTVSDEEQEEISEIFMFGLLALNEVRYLEPRMYNIAKSQHWYHNILPSYDDVRFKKVMRMFPENFEKLVNLLSSHSIFQTNSVKKQAPVELQLAVFLRRLGSKEDVFSICSRYGIAEGTVLLYCKRIMKAIISHKSDYIKWPTNEQDREFVHDGFKSIGGIEDIIGTIDGTHFILQNAPKKEKYLYFTRKKRYALHCQGIVDHRGIFIGYDVGWPGSVHDAKVYRNSHFYLNRSSLIKGNDFLIGDSAYPLSPFLIKPFSKPNENQIEFNRIFSSHRIVVEHSFGRIKNRFGGIKEISVKKISTAVNMIDCSIILHNFLELHDDLWVDCENNDNSEEDNNESDNYNNDNEESLKREGEAKRNWVMSKLFTTL